MISFADIPSHKQAFIFGFDDVLIPKKDYDLQVYYLFANFIEYLEPLPSAKDVITFIKKRYEIHKNEHMFREMSVEFGIDSKYKESLNLLFKNAKLPLKLLLYKEVLELLQELTINRKQIFIFTSGDPTEQLNKIKQTEWHGLDKYLKLYFADEFESSEKCLDHLINDNQLNKGEVLVLGLSSKDGDFSKHDGIDFKEIL